MAAAAERADRVRCPPMGLIVLFSTAAVVILVVLVGAAVRESLRPARRASGWALGVGWPVDPEAAGFAFDGWTLDRPGDVQLPVWDVRGDRDDGPVLILLHGFGRSRLTWVPYLADWTRRASRVVMIDLRGHGDATPDGAGLGDPDVEDVAALVERLDPPDDRPVVIIGRSLGATVGILAASICPRIDGVVAIAPYETLAVPLSQRIRLRGLPDRPITWLAIRVLALLGRRPRSTRAAAATLRVPLLVVQGTDDPISPEPGARAIAEAAPNARYELVEGAGHGDHWDLEPERLDDAVDEFLRLRREAPSARSGEQVSR